MPIRIRGRRSADVEGRAVDAHEGRKAEKQNHKATLHGGRAGALGAAAVEGGALEAFDPGKTPVVYEKINANSMCARQRASTSSDLPLGRSAAHVPAYDHSPRSREKILRSRR